MVTMNVVAPHFGNPLVTRVRGTITVRTLTSEFSSSRLLQERGERHNPGGVLELPTSDAALDAAAAPEPWPRPINATRRRKAVPNTLSEWQCSPEGLQFTSHAHTSFYQLTSPQYVEMYNGSMSVFQWCRGADPQLVPHLKQVWPGPHIRACIWVPCVWRSVVLVSGRLAWSMAQPGTRCLKPPAPCPTQVALLRSEKPRPPRGLTVVTQLSVERFEMLENQCRNWPYQISATLYIPLVGGRMFSAEDKAWHKQPVDVAIVQVGRGEQHSLVLDG